MTRTIATLRTAFADSRANRTSFGVQMLLMAVNDVSWVVFWGLFFGRVRAANGWTFDDVVVMFALLNVIAGVSLGLFANCRHVGQLFADGALDELLVLPLIPLWQLLARRVEPTNLGDLAFGVVLFAVAGHPTPQRCLFFLAGAATGSLVVVGFLVLIGSLTMFIGGRGEQTDVGFNALVILASYPLDFFGGPVKLLLYTLVPAAFVTGVPVSLVRHFDPVTAAMLMLVATGTFVTATLVFAAGLRRYSSGSLWRR